MSINYLQYVTGGDSENGKSIKHIYGSQRKLEDQKVSELQCDQIGQFIGLWATFQSLWQQLICPNLQHS